MLKFLDSMSRKTGSPHNYDEQDLAVFPKLRASLMTFSIFLKPMSDGECSRPFQRLDEAEWRLPCVRGKEELFKPTGVGRPPFKLPFCPSDMEVLVFPDPKTRDMAWADRDIARKLSQIKGGTPTVDECRDT